MCLLNTRYKLYWSSFNLIILKKQEYKESVPRDFSVGQVVMRISATDIDDKENGKVWYRLDSHLDKPGDLDYFQISEKTGEVQLKKAIDAVNFAAVNAIVLNVSYKM